MVAKRTLSPRSIWDVGQVKQTFAEAGAKESHIPRLLRYLIANVTADFADVPDIPRGALELLQKHYVRTTSSVEKCQTSADKQTTKLLITLQDGLQCEAVIMHYDTTGITQGQVHGKRRATLCVSSQIGCQMGCTFCATGTMGLRGNLTAGEIVEQLLHAKAVTPIHNVVFMGMGEPLNNYSAVRDAVTLMTHNSLFALRRSAVTVSTVGVIPRIQQLAQDLPGVSLALSLHAPTQELRKTLVPSAAAYKLDRLMAAVCAYQEQSGRKVFVEYVVLAGVNDQPEQAAQLADLLQGQNVTLNLIPWNPVYSPGIAFAAPSSNAVTAFWQLLKERGIHVTIRQEKGSDISGACGQLVVEQGMAGSKPGKALGDVEDLVPAAVCVA